MNNLSLIKKLILYYIFGFIFCALLLSLLMYTVITPDIYTTEQYAKQSAFETKIMNIEKDLGKRIQIIDEIKNKIRDKRIEEVKAIADVIIKNADKKEEVFIFDENKLYYGDINKEEIDLLRIKNLGDPTKTVISIFNK